MTFIPVLKLLKWKWILSPKTSRTSVASGCFLPISQTALFCSQFFSLTALLVLFWMCLLPCEKADLGFVGLGWGCASYKFPNSYWSGTHILRTEPLDFGLDAKINARVCSMPAMRRLPQLGRECSRDTREGKMVPRHKRRWAPYAQSYWH